ncbi:haloacid dehalogenase type II [Halostella sp. JP-L12]|uniref:haloacid dehalogenase type II n=1 Tax=Halostella TaxID=1843185 RepID=UPI000EF84C46|nr:MULTISPECIES: haloacid dehalogenase type II [Halostella]NHN48066.1 haloacid dehalogenase type II [Halostella sp. JP-L12]
MPLDIGEVETITFDSFTTIVDVETTTRRALAKHVDDPASVADLWRSRAVDYRMVSTFTDNYETYEETTRDALEYALAAHDCTLPDDAIDEIASAFHELDVYEDVRPGMERLVDAGYELYVLSNGNPAVLDSMVRRASIGDLIADTISADELQVYKPDPRIYEYAADSTNTAVENVLHVATPWYDIYGAKHAGNQTVWLNRNDAPWDRFDGEPDLTVETFEELVTAVI